MDIIISCVCQNASNDCNVYIPGYTALRQDRKLTNTKKKRGGGLITFVHERHNDIIHELPDLSISNKHCDTLWTKLNMPNCRDIIICNIYRPPGSKLANCIEYLENCLSSINVAKTDIFILWDLNVDFGNKNTTDYKKLSFFLKSNQLTQLIKENTRITQNTATTIDLAITNCKYIANSGTMPNYISDHQPIKKKDRDNRPKISFKGRSYRDFKEEEFKNTLRDKELHTIIDLTTPYKSPPLPLLSPGLW